MTYFNYERINLLIEKTKGLTYLEAPNKTYAEMLYSAYEEQGELAQALLAEKFGKKKISEPAYSECVDVFITGVYMHYATVYKYGIPTKGYTCDREFKYKKSNDMDKFACIAAIQDATSVLSRMAADEYLSNVKPYVHNSLIATFTMMGGAIDLYNMLTDKGYDEFCDILEKKLKKWQKNLSS